MPAGVAYYERRHHEPFVLRRESVEFGFSLPGRGPLAKPDQSSRSPRRPTRSRYASIFVTDHVVLPASHGALGLPLRERRASFPGGAAQDYLEPLAHARLPRARDQAHPARHQRARHPLSPSPGRPPRCWRRSISSRAAASSSAPGVGWLREEFEALGAPPFEERGAVTDEYSALMRAAWTTDPVTFEGRYYSVRDVHALPEARAARRHPRLDRRPHRRGACGAPPRSATAGTRSRCGRRACCSPTSTAKASQQIARVGAGAPGRDPEGDHAHAPRADGGPRRSAEGAGRRPAAVPGHRRRGARRHPALRARSASRHFVFDSHRIACSGPGALRPRPNDGRASPNGRAVRRVCAGPRDGRAQKGEPDVAAAPSSEQRGRRSERPPSAGR